MNPLREAAERIPGSWCSMGWEDENGNGCGLNHLCCVLDRNNLDGMQTPSFTIAVHLLGKVLREQYPDRIKESGFFGTFNDHPDTTEAEVIAVMEKAAVLWDERLTD